MMSSPTDPPTAFPSVGPEDGCPNVRGLAVLHPLNQPVEFMRFCPKCQEETRFIAQIEMLNGLWGCCANCGDERVVPYTRTVEAA
ncbi:MAG TPA: hypothetical protein VMQ17_08875 [Candidatus Sulfotelmatobacter sp.]|nr:hypothetical protein [Candidatus Sulfotelmatobacter sp.]